MKISNLQTFSLKFKSKFADKKLPTFFALFLLLGISLLSFQFAETGRAQITVRTPAEGFRTGERLTYNFSFERFKNVAFAEIYVVSRGKLEGRDAFELRSKLKTLDLFSAAFYLIDESRTTFASAENGLPLYIRKVSNTSGLPQEDVKNFLIAPAVNHDLLTLIYQARQTGGIGNFQFQENGRIYNAGFTPMGNERVKTDAGEFETVISAVQSEFLTENGIRDLRINFSVDAARIPVQIRFRTDKGEFRGALASLQIIDESPEPTVGFPTPAPRTSITPTPIPTADTVYRKSAALARTALRAWRNFAVSGGKQQSENSDHHASGKRAQTISRRRQSAFDGGCYGNRTVQSSF